MKYLISLILMATILIGKTPIRIDKKDVKWDDVLVKRLTNEYKRLTPEQLNIMHLIMEKCKQYDLSYTCAAISWRESGFGVYGFNPITKDYGVMGVNLKWYLINNMIKANYFQKIKIATMLIRNDDVNIAYAVEQLLYWKKRYGKDWINIWASYNGGSKPYYPYAKEILNRVIVLKRMLKE